MEALPEELPYPCEFFVYGCRAKPLLKHKASHEKTCEFSPYACPVDRSCKWKGLLNGMPAHIRNTHKHLVLCSGEKMEFTVDISTVSSGSFRGAALHSSLGGHFVIFFKKQSAFGYELIRLAIENLVTPREAEEFNYCVEIKVAGDCKTAWKLSPSFSPTHVDAAIARGDHLVFDLRNISGNCTKFKFRATVQRTPVPPVPLK